MTDPFIFIARFRVHEGKLADLSTLASAFADFVDEHEATSLGIQFFANEAGTELGYIQVQPDAEAMDTHMRLTHDRIAAALDMLEPTEIVVYGTPGPVLTQALEHNRQIGASVTVLPQHLDGFFRTVVAAAGA